MIVYRILKIPHMETVMLKVAGIQMDASPDKTRNIENAARMIKVASERGAKVVCLQELFNTRWFPYEINDAHLELAEDIQGRTIRTLKKTAKESGIAVIAPFFEKDAGEFYNSAAAIGPDGELIGVYRKAHIPRIPLYEEKYYFTPGNLGFPVFDTGHAKVGVLLGWDNLFPEGARILALKGAQIIFSPTAAASVASRPTWEKSISAGAIANGVYIFRINRVGKEERQEFYGGSFCVNPEGDMVGKPSGTQEGVILCSVDLKMVDRVRKEWSFLRDRRPEMYEEIASLRG